MRIILAIAILAAPASALPCSPPRDDAAYSVFPPDGATVGPNTLLMQQDGAPMIVVDSSGQEIEMQTIDGGDLAGASGRYGQELTFYQPTVPFSPGQYTMSYPNGAAARTFTVDDAGATPPPQISDVKLHLAIQQPSEPGVGCLGDGSPCGYGPITRLDIRMEANDIDDATNYFVTLTSTRGQARRLLRPIGDRTIGILSSVREIGSLEEDEVCVTVAPVAADGAVGAIFDTGCIDPYDSSDRRVEDHRDDAGCAALRGQPSVMWLALWSCGALAFRRLKHRRMLHA